MTPISVPFSKNAKHCFCDALQLFSRLQEVLLILRAPIFRATCNISKSCSFLAPPPAAQDARFLKQAYCRAYFLIHFIIYSRLLKRKGNEERLVREQLNTIIHVFAIRNRRCSFTCKLAKSQVFWKISENMHVLHCVVLFACIWICAQDSF